MHVPAKIGRRAIEPVVDHLGDFGATGEGAVEHVVVDAILREQIGKDSTVALFDGVAEGAEHGCVVHGVTPYFSCHAPRKRGIQYSQTFETNREVAAYW